MSYYEFHVARRYVQFEGALREFGNYASLVGQKLLILTACDPVREMVESRIREGLSLPAAACMNPALAQASPRYARRPGDGVWNGHPGGKEHLEHPRKGGHGVPEPG